MSRRLVAAGAAVLAVIAVVAYVLTRPSGPRWAGPALAADRGQATEVALVDSAPADPRRVAAAALGVPEAALTVTEGLAGKIYAAERPAKPGAPPERDAAIATARRLLAAFGMAPEQWQPVVRPETDVRAVRFVPLTDLPPVPTRAVPLPSPSVDVDAGGVRSFSVPALRLAPRPVQILSQREAWGRITEDGAYDRVRLVLVPGNGVLEPYWEFRTKGGAYRPVRAVLTP